MIGVLCPECACIQKCPALGGSLAALDYLHAGEEILKETVAGDNTG